MSEDECSFFRLRNNSTLPMSFKNIRSLEQSANSLQQASSTMSSLLKAVSPLLGQFSDSKDPTTFSFNDTSSAKDVGFLLAAMNDVSHSLLSLSVEARLRSLHHVRETLVHSVSTLTSSESASLLSDPFQQASVFGPKNSGVFLSGSKKKKG